VSVLDRKLRRDLRSSRGLLLAIVSIIAVGVACYVEMSSIHRNLTTARRVYYAQCRMADFSIELKKVPVSQLAVVEQMPEVLELRPRIKSYVTVDLERVESLLNGLVLSLPDRRTASVNDIVLRRGSYFSDTRDNEVIVNDAFARRHALRPGQWIHVLLNNRRQALFVVGTCISSEFVYLVGPGAIAPDPEHFGVFYLKQSYAEEVFDMTGAANEVVGRLVPAVRAHPDDVLARAEAALEPYGVLSTTGLKFQPSNRYLSEEIEGLATFTTIMPSIFLTVAALVLNVLMVRYTEQQRTVVGTLKALGYGDLEVFWHFLKYGLAVGLSGGLIGCLAGYGLATWITGVYTQFYEFPVLENRLYPGKMLFGVGISLACAAVGTWHGARQVLRLTPAAAMRAKPPEKGRAILLERFAVIWQRLGFGWRMVLRNIVRHRFRTLAGLFAAAMGASILVTGFMLNAAMVHLVEFQFNRIQRSDIDLAFKDERGRAALLESRGLPGVDYAEPVLDVPCTFVHGPYRRRGAITGLMPGARLTIPRDTAGRRVAVPEFGVIITRKMAEVLHLDVGDRLTVRPNRGNRTERTTPVAAIADSYLGMAVYADQRYLNWLVDEEYAVNGVQLSIDGTRQGRRDLYRQLKRLPGVQSVNERADSIHNITDTIIKTQRIFIGLLIFFAGVIFFGSILNSSLIGLAERTREVATLRVMGYTETQVGGLFLRESLVINSLGTLLGLPLGYGLTILMSWSYDTELFRFPVVFSARTAGWTVLLSVVFGLAAHTIVQRTINRLNWREALNVRE
jgi:putative ABC transport system permease protein